MENDFNYFDTAHYGQYSVYKINATVYEKAGRWQNNSVVLKFYLRNIATLSYYNYKQRR